MAQPDGFIDVALDLGARGSAEARLDLVRIDSGHRRHRVGHDAGHLVETLGPWKDTRNVGRLNQRADWRRRGLTPVRKYSQGSSQGRGLRGYLNRGENLLTDLGIDVDIELGGYPQGDGCRERNRAPVQPASLLLALHC